MDFNQSKDTYRKTIQESINFAGKDHDFFIEVKAEFLKSTVRQFLPHIEKPRLLDIGCGHGFIHSRLHNKGFEIVGVDLAEEVLGLARELNPDVLYVEHNGEALPFPSETFDIAIAICVMHHVPPQQWKAFLAEMKRILRPGGLAVIFEHNPYNPLTRWIVSKNILDHDAILLSSPHLKKMMIHSGFNDVKSRFILFTPFGLPVFRWLDKKLGWCPLGAQYYTVAVR